MEIEVVSFFDFLTSIQTWQLIAVIAIGVIIGVFAAMGIKALSILIWKLLVISAVNFSKLFKTAKQRCAKIQCPFCGKQLDKCSCSKNANRSYSARLRLYHKWLRNKNRAQKKKDK